MRALRSAMILVIIMIYRVTKPCSYRVFPKFGNPPKAVWLNSAPAATPAPAVNSGGIQQL